MRPKVSVSSVISVQLLMNQIDSSSISMTRAKDSAIGSINGGLQFAEELITISSIAQPIFEFEEDLINRRGALASCDDAADLYVGPGEARSSTSPEARNGEHSHLRYRMQHDLYSLSVALLEIGLRMSLEKEKSLRSLRTESWNDEVSFLFLIKERLVALASSQKLSITMDARYQNIASSYLDITVSESYDLSAFLFDIVWPLWEVKSSLQGSAL
ncbi:hypothetical protein QBC43DRAFT_283380 [Cladorrhinum sp. PSN259]|nr:hypothetical protein QBC43DRAFT_283380 [Cladorrhinum sp. PSN259]